MESPLVSVVLPTHNSNKIHLGKAIESILRQTYTNFELIIVDDASTDDTYQHLKAFAELDDRIKIYRNEVNLGIASNRNRGIALSEGKYYAPMDHDDISLETRLEKEVQFLEANPSCCVFGSQCKIINEKDTVFAIRNYPTANKDVIEKLPIESPFCNPSTMIRMKNLRDCGLFQENIPGVEDYDMWFRLAQTGTLNNINEYLFHYRSSKHQTKHTQTKTLLRYTLKVKLFWLAKPNMLSGHALGRFLLEFGLLVLPSCLVNYIFKLLKYNNHG